MRGRRETRTHAWSTWVHFGFHDEGTHASLCEKGVLIKDSGALGMEDWVTSTA